MFKPYGKRSVRSLVAASAMSDLLDRWPRLYLALLKARLGDTSHRIIDPRHSLVIEAFPRSGSSFAHRAFQAANPDQKGLVATHLHRASQVRRAGQLGTPSLILVRQPRDSVVSLLALSIQQGQVPRMTAAEVQRAMAAKMLRYARFHERILPLKNIVIAGFDEVIQDFGAVTQRLNAACATQFMPFDHTPEAVAALKETSRVHLSPSADRDAIKAELLSAYEAPALHTQRARAEAAHAAMITRRDAQKQPKP